MLPPFHLDSIKDRKLTAFHSARLTLAMMLLLALSSGCSMSSNKLFSWMKPKQDGAPTPTEKVAENEAPKAEGELAADPNKLAVMPVSAARKLSPIQRELSEFQSFPFDVDMVDVSGRAIRLQELRGKVVIVDLWGTWCGPCRRVIPHLVKLQEQHPQDLQVIGLCNERTPDKRAATASLQAAMAEFKINYPCVLIDDSTTRKVPNFSGYPTMLFIDRAGKVRMSTVGVKPEAYWDALIAELLAS